MNGNKTRCMKFDFFGILLIRFLFNDLLGELVLCWACASFKFQLNIVWASSWHDMFVCGVQTKPQHKLHWETAMSKRSAESNYDCKF